MIVPLIKYILTFLVLHIHPVLWMYALYDLIQREYVQDDKLGLLHSGIFVTLALN